MHFSSSKDKYLIMASMCYFGVIEDIWVIDYTSFRVPIFKCKWVDGNIGVKTDDLGFTLVDLEKEGYTKEPFIMASQAKQVFFVLYNLILLSSILGTISIYIKFYRVVEAHSRLQGQQITSRKKLQFIAPTVSS